MTVLPYREQFKTDYDALQVRLQTLPEKVTHDVMVRMYLHVFLVGNFFSQLVNFSKNEKPNSSQLVNCSKNKKLFLVILVSDFRLGWPGSEVKYKHTHACTHHERYSTIDLIIKAQLERICEV